MCVYTICGKPCIISGTKIGLQEIKTSARIMRAGLSNNHTSVPSIPSSSNLRPGDLGFLVGFGGGRGGIFLGLPVEKKKM